MRTRRTAQQASPAMAITTARIIPLVMLLATMTDQPKHVLHTVGRKVLAIHMKKRAQAVRHIKIREAPQHIATCVLPNLAPKNLAVPPPSPAAVMITIRTIG